MQGLVRGAPKALRCNVASHTLFRCMHTDTSFSDNHRTRNSYAYTNILQYCKTTKCIKVVHAQIIIGGFERNPFVATKLVGKYTAVRGANLQYARKVFDNLSDRDVFLWNVVIKGYANLGPFLEALDIYDEMRSSRVPANRYTYPLVLKACGAEKALTKGQVIHGHVVKSGFDLDVFVGNALLAFYAKCQEVALSRRVFEEIPHRDVVSWNSMISGYAVNGCNNEALILFHAMTKDIDVGSPDNATLVGVLPACLQAAAIQAGFWIHCYIIKSGMTMDASLGSGLILLYSNCGYISNARAIFDRILDKNIVVWNAIIKCYGMHGHTHEALAMFSQSIEAGVTPDGLIFLCLLSACSHAGMLDEGCKVFNMMELYGVEKSEEHYASMVDLLGRAGCLQKAVELIQSMPIKAGKSVYGAVLGACKIHNNIELAEWAAEKLFVLDPENAGRYVNLAKVYEDAGRWQDAARIRILLREKEIKKQAGFSSIEVDSIHHTFGVKDDSHPFTEEIHQVLMRLERTKEEDNSEFSEFLLLWNNGF